MNSSISKPSRLYKYLPINTQTLENIKSQVIYFGSPLNFNDPYDCAIYPEIKAVTKEEANNFRNHWLYDRELPADLKNGFESMDDENLYGLISRSADNALRQRINLFQEQNGVSCFSEANDNLLMWSHYADKYRGLCLEFDTGYEPFHKMKKVKYSQDFPIIDATKMMDSHNDEIISLFATKSLDWNYEKEWRVMHTQSKTEYHYDKRALTGVFFGPNTSIAIKEIIYLILFKQNNNIKFWQGGLSKKKFSVEFEALGNPESPDGLNHYESKRN